MQFRCECGRVKRCLLSPFETGAVLAQIPHEVRGLRYNHHESTHIYDKDDNLVSDEYGLLANMKRIV